MYLCEGRGAKSIVSTTLSSRVNAPLEVRFDDGADACEHQSRTTFPAPRARDRFTHQRPTQSKASVHPFAHQQPSLVFSLLMMKRKSHGRLGTLRKETSCKAGVTRLASACQMPFSATPVSGMYDR